MIDEIKEEKEKLTMEMRERSIGYIAGAFGLVAGLAWNDAIKAFIEYLFPLSKNTLVAKFIYALILTVVVVVVTTYISRLFSKRK
ncbi:MAG: DUF5654 family protein [Patescibacteria group bacterium]|nr:DUF5654 family protein [Patescibacteria group bacterium]